MTEEQTPPAAPAQNGGAAGRKGGRRATGRKLAEWVSLGISALLLLGVASFLLYQALQPDLPYLVAEATALLDQVQQEQDRYILPIEITNQGDHTLRELSIEVRFQSPEGRPETRDLQIDYLGERAKQTAYLYFDQDPRRLQVEVTPQHYRLE